LFLDLPRKQHSNVKENKNVGQDNLHLQLAMLPAGRDPRASASISVKIETHDLRDQQEQVRILFPSIT